MPKVDHSTPGGFRIAIRRIIMDIGDDPDREGLRETPDRVFRAHKELFAGYHQHPNDVMKTFKKGACREMVVLADIEFTSWCEHHMLPFHGKGHVGYVPNGRVIGVSKLGRLLDIYACRLQIQERIGQQVVAALMKYLKPKGAGCIIESQHECMRCRGVCKRNAIMRTSALEGTIMKDAKARDEFLRMCGL